MFYTYIITNRLKGKLYTGHTEDLVQRMEQHKYKIFSGYAAKHHCQYLLWYEEYESRHDAFIRERRIKKWKRVWKIHLIEQDNPEWLDIMACPTWPLPEGELFDDLRDKAFREARIPIGAPPHFHPIDLPKPLSLPLRFSKTLGGDERKETEPRVVEIVVAGCGNVPSPP